MAIVLGRIFLPHRLDGDLAPVVPWGTAKSLVFGTIVDTRKEFMERIIAVFDNVKERVEEIW